MKALLQKKGFICDMDGVIYHGDRLLPVWSGSLWTGCMREKKEFLFLTNNSGQDPAGAPGQSCSRMGLDIDEKHFYTSALATAEFVAQPEARAPGPLSSGSPVCSTPSTSGASPSMRPTPTTSSSGSPGTTPTTASAGRPGA